MLSMNPQAKAAVAEGRAVDAQGHMYAPTAIGLDASANIDDDCPVRYEIGDERTFVVFGDANTGLSVQFSDRALIDFMRVGNNAVRELPTAEA
ncbi:MAG TPA: hypothetical protein VFW65_30675 [Pseudonocardiaceae bacterium]|nr:hypothetical protein [Pseudonocardiaceae bacterium]